MIYTLIITVSIGCNYEPIHQYTQTFRVKYTDRALCEQMADVYRKKERISAVCWEGKA